jgi:tetratricopeptide (TPR) repeat protein
MSARRSFASAAVVLAAAACALWTAGCVGDDAASPAAAPALRSVSLPDLSKTAPSVRDQILSVHASALRLIEAPRTPPAEKASAYGELGKLLMAAEFGSSAESCLLNARTLAPADMRWPYYLGHLYKAQGAIDRSIAAFEEALKLRPDDVPTLMWLAEGYLSLDRPEAAGPHFATARSLQSASAAPVAGLGRVALAKQDYAGAVKFLEEALAIDPRASAVHYPLGLAYRSLGDLAKAEFHLQRRGGADVPFADPLMSEVRGLLKSAAAYESLGIAALEGGDLATATKYFRRGLEVAPDSASLHHRLGTALVLGGDARAGQEQFEAALKLEPNLARAHYSLGVVMASAGRPSEAIQRLSAAVKAEPDYVEARLLLGDMLRHSGRARESLPHYRHVLALDPRSSAALLRESLVFVGLGDYRQARERLAEARNAHPTHADISEALVRILAAAPDGAVRDGRRAVAIMQEVIQRQAGPEQSEAMAMAYAEAGDFPQAVAWQRKAVAAAEAAGRDPHLRDQMLANLSQFERGEPCRIPWRAGTMP